MKYIHNLIVCLLLLSSCNSDDTSTSSPSQDELIAQQLQSLIDEKIGNNTDKLVGVSVSIRIDGEERWKLTGGLSRLNEPVTSDMLFGVGSVTKTVVAATILKLVDENILNLGDTIDDWLNLNLANVDNTITIQQLLSHFTGLDGYMYPEVWEKAEADKNTPIPALELTNYIGEPINNPGVTHEYTNANYLILGLIIEAATNKTVGEVMRDRFFSPLGLNNIYFGANEAIQGPICVPWRDNDGDGTLEDISDDYGAAFHSIFFCAADVFSSASDLSMWAQHLFNGDAISNESRTKMMTSYFNIPHPTFTGYGLGVRRNVYNGRIMWGHTGGMRGYGSHMFYDPISKISIAVLNNQSRSANGPQLRHELTDGLLKILFESL